MSSIEGILEQLLQPAVDFLLAAITAGVVEVLLYGIHIVLFCVCMFILVRKRQTTQWFITISAVIMFVLSTADVAITIHVLTHDLGSVFNQDKLSAVEKRVGYKIPLFVTNNFIADLILLYRCYMVWGRSKYILIGASVFVLADTIWGYMAIVIQVNPVNITFVPMYIWTIFGINLVLAVVTVGRIFWVSKMAEPLLRGTNPKSYHTAMAVIIESSVIYSACILVYITFPGPSAYRLVPLTVCFRLVTIMPTLLIVQVGLGRAVTDSTRTTTTTSEFRVEAHTTNPNSVVLDALIFSSRNGYPTRSVSEGDNHHSSGNEIRGISPGGLMSGKRGNQLSLLENPTRQ